MVLYGYAKDYYYTNDGVLQIRVRIPQIHGAFSQSDYRGKPVRGYVLDENLPYFPSVLLPHLPIDGEVVALSSINESMNEFLVIGLTGASYYSGKTTL